MRIIQTEKGGTPDRWHFPWIRDRSGYAIQNRRIATRRGAEETVEVVRVIDPAPRNSPDASEKPHSLKLYYPFREDNCSISREFCQIRTTEAIVKFANKYGLLGLENIPGATPDYLAEISAEAHEPTSEWFFEAERLRRMYRVWDLVESKDKKGLKAIIRCSQDETGAVAAIEAVFEDDVRVGGPFCGAGTRWLERWNGPKLLFEQARVLLVDEFNKTMDGMAALKLLIDPYGRLRSYQAPVNLLGAIWLEFGEVISGARRQIRCESCNEWWDVTQYRRDKRKHDNCILREKMARYRKKLKGRLNVPAVDA
jgi:hypothetical protein